MLLCTFLRQIWPRFAIQIRWLFICPVFFGGRGSFQQWHPLNQRWIHILDIQDRSLYEIINVTVFLFVRHFVVFGKKEKPRISQRFILFYTHFPYISDPFFSQFLDLFIWDFRGNFRSFFLLFFLFLVFVPPLFINKAQHQQQQTLRKAPRSYRNFLCFSFFYFLNIL